MKSQCDMIRTARNGLSFLTDDAISAIKDFLQSQFNDDGGAAGRDGVSDIYYTVFGCQLLHVFKYRNFKKITLYLEKCNENSDYDFVQLASLVRCRALAGITDDEKQRNLIAQIESYRSEDGGFNHNKKNASSGTAYAAFVAYLAYLESGIKISQPKRLLESLQQLKREDGSYANDKIIDSGSTTATAAVLVLQHQLKNEMDADAVQNLLLRQHLLGGFLAGSDSPVPDLLSTATALYALSSGINNFDIAFNKHSDFVTSLWNEDGGFSGQIFDSASDIEYTFYALLALGVIARKNY